MSARDFKQFSSSFRDNFFVDKLEILLFLIKKTE